MQDGKVCMMCGKAKADSAYYKSSSAYHKDGLIPICRNCIMKAAYDPNSDGLDIESFKTILRQVDKPFFPDVLESAEREIHKKYPTKDGQNKVKTQIGFYFKNINSLNQYQSMTWTDSKVKTDDPAPTGGGDNRQIVYLADFDNLFDSSMFTEKQLPYLKALYAVLKDMYHVKDQRQRDMLAIYVKDCLILQGAIAYNDGSTLVDCISEMLNELILLKNMLGGQENTHFADYLEDLSDSLQEED